MKLKNYKRLMQFGSFLIGVLKAGSVFSGALFFVYLNAVLSFTGVGWLVGVAILIVVLLLPILLSAFLMPDKDSIAGEFTLGDHNQNGVYLGSFGFLVAVSLAIAGIWSPGSIYAGTIGAAVGFGALGGGFVGGIILIALICVAMRGAESHFEFEDNVIQENTFPPPVLPHKISREELEQTDEKSVEMEKYDSGSDETSSEKDEYGFRSDETSSDNQSYVPS